MKKHVRPLFGWLVLWCFATLLPVQHGNAQTVKAAAAKAEEGGEHEGKGCCAYTLQFVNLYEAKYIKKIRVSAMCDTRICCADPDEWAQGGDISDFVEWYPADSTAVPFGNAIDNEFMIYLDSETSPYFLQVEWFDMNDSVVCRHNIEITCDGPFKEEDEDWTQYTTRTALNDDRLFVFAVREDEEDEDACEDFYKSGFCLFSTSITCQGINTYLVNLDAPDGFELYQWQIISGPAAPSISSEQHTSVELTVPGTYIIALEADHLDTEENCSTEETIVIPAFTPNFTTQRVPSPCSATFKFTPYGAADPETVDHVQWACVGIPGFPSYSTYDGNVQYTFTTEGTYVITVTFIDIYGCAHSDTTHLNVSFDCVAGAEVDKYYLCYGCQGEEDIQVFFNNTSTGGTCPLTFTWNFGDGTPPLTTNETQLSVPHTYTVPNCAGTNNYTVTLVMTDSAPDPCVDSITIPVVIAPCRPDVTWVVCPDGKIKLTANVKGTFTFTPPLDVVWAESETPDEDGLRSYITVRACSAGTYVFTFEGHCNTGGRCIISKTITVDEIFCCAKNDADRDKYDFPEADPEYRMKYKMVQRQFFLYHKIRLKTKLKKKKNLWGITYWKGTKADQIEAHADGIIYKKNMITGCNCELPNTVDDGVVKYNKKKAKKNIGIGSKFRSRLNSLISTHRVVKGGYDITKNLDLGNDCDDSCQ